jgi:hypothetical protein
MRKVKLSQKPPRSGTDDCGLAGYTGRTVASKEKSEIGNVYWFTETLWRIEFFSTPNGFADMSRPTYLHDASGNSLTNQLRRSMRSSIARDERGSVRTSGNSFFETQYLWLDRFQHILRGRRHASTVEEEPAVICGAQSFGERFPS